MNFPWFIDSVGQIIVHTFGISWYAQSQCDPSTLPCRQYEIPDRVLVVRSQ